MTTHPIKLAGKAIRILGMLLAIVASGCATVGQAYQSHNIDRIEVGKTTTSQVIALLGQPRAEDIRTLKKDWSGADLPQPIVARALIYSFGSPSSSAGLPWVQPARWTNVMLIDDVVVAYWSASSFKEDFTDVEVVKAGRFETGKTTGKEVVSTLGRPTGRGIYPVAASPKGHSLFYAADLKNYPLGFTTRKRVWVYLDDQDVVEDFTVDSHADAIPVAPVSTPVTVYVPPVRSIKSR